MSASHDTGRLRALARPTSFTFDGERVEGELGEPVACALVALGRMPWARSPKFHRPRGPACLRAACDGCLARVDGEPNVMTCTVPLAPDMDVRTQNTLGSRTIDLLRITDWFFPDGFNHHELFAGVTGVQTVMEVFARRVAGLGRLPARSVATKPASRRRLDALVIGAGPAGMAAALTLADRGRAVEIVDEGFGAGGSLRALHEAEMPRIHEVGHAFERALHGGLVAARTRAVVGAIFERDVLVVGEGGAEILDPETLVLAPGAHDGVLAFEGNDLPGVMSARACATLVGRGVRPGDHVLIAAPGEPSPFTRSIGRILSGTGVEVTVVEEPPVRVTGSSRVREVELGGRRVRADLCVVDVEPSPAYELAQQAGATLVHEPRGYVPALREAGRIDARTWIVGESAGARLAEEMIDGVRAVIGAI